MTYSANAYWQAEANRCKQFADEGACLARVSRRVPVTIVPGFGGLGQVDTGVTTLAPGGVDIRAIQTALIHAGVLSIRTADGLISSATSPTLAAIRAWATSNGLSSTGTGRTADSGLVIPTALLNRILAITTAPATPGPTEPASVKPSELLPSFTATSWPNWLPWALGGVAVVGVGAFVMRRRRVKANRRRRRNAS